MIQSIINSGGIHQPISTNKYRPIGKTTKRQIGKYVTYKSTNKPIPLSKFTWNEETLLFETEESGLNILNNLGESILCGVTFKTRNDCDFITGNNCGFITGNNCTFKTSSDCTFKTGSDCIFNTNDYCMFDTKHLCEFKTGSYCMFIAQSRCEFKTDNRCEFKTDDYCKFETSNNCRFETDNNCDFKTGSSSFFKTTYNCNFICENSCIFATRGNCDFIVDSNCIFDVVGGGVNRFSLNSNHNIIRSKEVIYCTNYQETKYNTVILTDSPHGEYESIIYNLDDYEKLTGYIKFNINELPSKEVRTVVSSSLLSNPIVKLK